MITIGNNLKVSLGKIQDGQNFFVDFGKDNIGLTLLVGQTGSGKSVLHHHIYKQLVEQNSSYKIGFVFIDNTLVDFSQSDKNSPYLYYPVSRTEEALGILENLGDKIYEINNSEKHLFIHIEECDLFVISEARMEKVLKRLLAQKANFKVHIIFSTSRPSPDIFSDWLLDLADLKIICEMASPTDYITVTGKDYSKDFTEGNVGEKIILFKNEVYHLLPLTAEETKSADSFKL